MGGLLARMAINWLESTNYEHQVGLYASYDSPHKGASVPKALQHLAIDVPQVLGTGGIDVVLFYRSLAVSILTNTTFYNNLIDGLNSKAARQLLVDHYDEPNLASYNELQGILNTVGYPKKGCRNISFINGSSSGLTQQSVVLGWRIVDIKMFYILSNARIRADYSEPNSGTNEISEVWYYGFPASHAKIIRSESDVKFTYSNLPGGTKGTDKDKPNYINGEKIEFEFCFVPSMSGIDLRSDVFMPSLLYGNGTYFNNNEQFLHDNNLTPFDDIYHEVKSNGTSKNTEHTKYFQENKDVESPFLISSLIRNEIMSTDKYIQACTNSNNRDYTATNRIFAGNNVTPTNWDKTIANQPVVIKATANVNYTAGSSIKLLPGFKVEKGATFKTHLVGSNSNARMANNSLKLTVSPTITGNANICEPSTFKGSLPSKATYSWQLTGNGQIFTGTGNTFTTPNNLPLGQYGLELTATNQNGELSTSTQTLKVLGANVCALYKNATSQTKMPDVKIEMYPNPNKGIFTIIAPMGTKKVNITNTLGQEVYNTNFTNEQVQINVTNLVAGTYLVKTEYNGKTDVQKLTIY